MQILPSAPQQTLMGSILHQSVFKNVERIGRIAADEDQARIHE